MTSIALKADPETFADADLVLPWLGSSEDAFKTKLAPDLRSLGVPSAQNADFVYIAATVWGADRFVLRRPNGEGWAERTLDLTVAVSDPAAWDAVADDLARALAFLSGDRWSLTFMQRPTRLVEPTVVPTLARRVVLVSGGADSACGALRSSSEEFITVSHTSNPATSLAQERVYGGIRAYADERLLTSHRIGFAPRKKAVDVARTEPTNRTRSLLFLALGLAVGSQDAIRLWIPENGFASLNPPLTAERLGALSTRTTQPWFLSEITKILARVGAHATLQNPFQMATKGEMFSEVRDCLGADAAAAFLSSTNSCSRVGQNFIGQEPGTHCGLCFGCLVRRASFIAGDVDDRTRYLNAEEKHRRWAESKSSWNALVDFVSTGVDDSDLMIMPLPDSFTQAQAADLCARGVRELEMLVR